jgi:hypothetical protein
MKYQRNILEIGIMVFTAYNTPRNQFVPLGDGYLKGKSAHRLTAVSRGEQENEKKRSANKKQSGCCMIRAVFGGGF